MGETVSMMQPFLVRLSGADRGRADVLTGDHIPLTIQADRLAGIAQPGEAPSAVLNRRGETFEIEAAEGQELWINGERQGRMVLASGDVIELGAGGPVIRFRLQPEGTGSHKSVQDVFSDCWACARYDGGGLLQQAGLLIGGIPMELATRTTLLFRTAVVGVLMVLAAATATLYQKNATLQTQLDQGRGEWATLVTRLNHGGNEPAGAETLSQLAADMRNTLAATSDRIEALEQRGGAASRVVASATQSTALLLGSYGFIEPKSGKTLRFVVNADRSVVREPNGAAAVTLDGQGPPVESFYTGTGFVVGDGLLMTNRHVALPWDFDEAAAGLIKEGLTPVMLRFMTYLPSIKEGLVTEFVAASDDDDIAVLRVPALRGRVPALPLAARAPQAGEEVLVMGYPLGLRALMARSGAAVVAEVMESKNLDAWSATATLAAGGNILPLASRGIVGQVNKSYLVYDAETTHGGSGGPVLLIASGEVVAINEAILPEFGGSNMGVPIGAARKLIAGAAAGTPK